MPVLRLFAAAREAAGVARADIEGVTVGEVLDAARSQFGDRFTAVLERSRVWVNGEPATPETPVTSLDVVAVLPPVSGGAGGPTVAVAPATPRPPRATRPPPPVRRPSVAAPRPPVEPVPETPDDRSHGRGQIPSPVADDGGLDTRPHRVELEPDGPEREPSGVGAGSRAASPPGPAGPGTGPSAPSPPGPAGAVSASRAASPPGPALPSPTDVVVADAAPAAPPPPLRRSTLSRLAVVHDTDGPHGRLGVLWAAVTVAATLAGTPWLAAWLGAAALMGASQAAGARRALDQRPPPPVAALVAGGLVGASVAGAGYVVAGAAAGLVLAGLARTLVRSPKAAVNVSLALVIGVVTGSAAASVVVTRSVDTGAALFLLACACTYDAGAYLVGTGAGSAWEGPTAGIVTLIPVTVLAAVILPVPPFPSGSPLALGLVAAVLAPLGPLVATAMLGDQSHDAPGLRRLDSLILLGPAWAWLVTTILK